MQSKIEGDGFLAIMGRWTNLGTLCLLIIVYAPQEQNKKRELWNNISSIINNANVLSVVLGDFNEVRYPYERLGTIFSQGGANKFNNFIFNSGLQDIPMGGKRFTRMNKSGSKLGKI